MNVAGSVLSLPLLISILAQPVFAESVADLSIIVDGDELLLEWEDQPG